MKKVSVIITAYNSSNTISKCIESVLNQSYKNLEIIIVNDGSIDNTLDIINSYKDKRLKVINQKNGGVYSARNIGLSKATGVYISFIDSDDFIDPNYYEIMIGTLESNNSDLVSCSYKDEKKYYIENYNQKKALEEIIKLPSKMDVTLCTKVFKKEVINNIKFKNYMVAEDMMFTAEAILNSNKITYINKKLYYYVQTKESLSRGEYKTYYNDKIKSSKELYELIIKKYKDLDNDFYAYYIFNSIGVLNRMILSNYYDETFYRKLIKKIQTNYDRIELSNYSKLKKNQVKLLLTNYYLYKIVYRILYKIRN